MQSNIIPGNEDTPIFPAAAHTNFLLVGRRVGILLLCQLVAGLTLPFILAKSVTAGSPAFLTTVAAQDLQVRGSVILSFIGSGLTVWLGLKAFKIFRMHSETVAILFLVVCAISCTLDLVHAATVMSMLSLSNSFVASGTNDTESYRVVAGSVASARRSAHITQLLAIGAWMFLFYISLFRFKLVPRALALVGVVGVALQFIGVTLMMLLGLRPIGEMAMPLLPIVITVGVWLIGKGFKDSRLWTESKY